MECFFFSSRRRHTRLVSDWSSDVCSSDLALRLMLPLELVMSWKVSQPPTAERLAIRDCAPAASAVTIRLLACDLRATFPPPASSRSNVSQPPMAVRLAISGNAPTLSAQTYRLLACDRRAITLRTVPP